MGACYCSCDCLCDCNSNPNCHRLRKLSGRIGRATRAVKFSDYLSDSLPPSIRTRQTPWRVLFLFRRRATL
jgi:hypothetical protein